MKHVHKKENNYKIIDLIIIYMFITFIKIFIQFL
jgi:hypothetical protein